MSLASDDAPVPAEGSSASNTSLTTPFESTPPIVSLPIPGFPAAVVSVPTGATAPRPVVVATHGLWDFPEGLCDNWQWIVGERAWVLCPRGDPLPDKTFRYRSGPALAKEIDAGVRALEEGYTGRVDCGPRLYTGFSLGAILGVWIVTHDPVHYPRAILIEGGEDRFGAPEAAAFARGGGQRVLFACGLAGRVPAATRAAVGMSVPIGGVNASARLRPHGVGAFEADDESRHFIDREETPRVDAGRG